MSQFLLQASYTNDSWATQVHARGNVLERIQPLMDAFGGSVNGCFYAFGDYDLVLLADFPGQEEAFAFMLAVKAGGSLQSTSVTPLISVEQGIAAMTRASEAARDYRPAVSSPAPLS